MGCCGKTNKITDIVIGTVADKVAQLPHNTLAGRAMKRIVSLSNKTDIELSYQRNRICNTCDEATHLTLEDYAKWAKEVGIVRVVANIEDLTKIQALPKKNAGEKTQMYCRVCKCKIHAKSIIKEEKCPLNKW